MSSSKPTIVDVAARARVSVGTVSHVLSGSIPVSERLRTRVLAAVEKLSFVPNHSARGLRGKRSRVIGLCFPHVSTTYPSMLSEAIEQLAAKDGYNILHVFSRHNVETEMRRIRELMSYRVDGLILFPTSARREPLDLVFEHNVPTVLIDRPTNEKRFDQVVMNNVLAMQKGVELLLSCGHANILFVSRSRENVVTRHRLEGMRAAQRRARGRLKMRTIEYRDDEQSLRDQLSRLFLEPAPPTAIIASNSHQAVLVLSHLRNIGVPCPEQVSLLAFDDPDWAELVTPRLSVIRQPAAAIAQKAWELLMRRIADRKAKPELIAIEAQFELRDSVAAPPPTAGRGRQAPRSAKGALVSA